MREAQHKHREIEELIPWYLNGTLSESEMDLVTQRLRECSHCREDVYQALIFARSFSTTTGPESTDLAAINSSLSELLSSLDAPPEVTHRKSVARAVAMAAIAAFALISFTFILWFMPPLEQQYQPLTSEVPYSTNGTVFQMVFARDENHQDIMRALDESGLRLLSGPSSQGVYRVELPPHLDANPTMALVKSRARILMLEKEMH